MASTKDKPAGSKDSKGETDPEWSIDGKPVKVNKWDAGALKNALDDSVKSIITRRYGCVEDHHLMNGRLLICTVAVLFAAFALVWDYFHPFPESKPILIVCVLSYFLLMGVLTLYTTTKEKHIFCSAVHKDKAGVDPDNVWSCSSIKKRYDDLYILTLEYTDGRSNQSRQATIQHTVTEFFDENGVLCHDLWEPIVCKLADSLLTEKKTK